MQKLLSVPPGLVECFHEIEKCDKKEWFCTSDPKDSKLGSGGGTTWLLQDCHRKEEPDVPFNEWLAKEKRILIHAGGQSRRLPAYATSGKILTPIPVFRWERGQKLGQNLLSMKTALYEKIMNQAPEGLHTLIAGGDEYLRFDASLPPIPDVDVVCYGLWADPELITHHGVFITKRNSPEKLDFMLQKPRPEELSKLKSDSLFQIDIGVWLLNDKAVDILIRHSSAEDGRLHYYDLYGDFGLAMGEHPQIKDDEINQLSVAILPLPGGEFYHYGTSKELISSTLAIQNLVRDQREIMHRRIKPHPAMFIQNTEIDIALHPSNSNLWIENCHIGKDWKISNGHVITGVPINNWNISLPPEICIDIIPIGETAYAGRPYGLNNPFRGLLCDKTTLYLNTTFQQWALERNINIDNEKLKANCDIQSAPLFPITESVEDLGIAMRWMISEPKLLKGYEIWHNARRISADELSIQANLYRLTDQRLKFRKSNWPKLADNYEQSVFYQLDLEDAAKEYTEMNIPAPELLSKDAEWMMRIHNSMFRARVNRLKGLDYKSDEERAFTILRQEILNEVLKKRQAPQLSVFSDQIVWGRSPCRIDLAGGWSDTPPYPIMAGGNVVNVAIELNGQPPLQVYVKPCKEYKIVLRSIDLGAREEITTYDNIKTYNKVGEPFSIPKAALYLAGFMPSSSLNSYSSLYDQLRDLGSGIEITVFVAIPAGSGLGTSSILAATVLGALSEFCGLGWDKYDICRRVLALEQLLTSGGGWQDQYGGILGGIKLLQSEKGIDQTPIVRWLPNNIYTKTEYRDCHLLYYTGIRRIAKNILSEIVGNMFLNSSYHLQLISEMKSLALNLYDVVQREDFESFGNLVGKAWTLSKAINKGTATPEINNIISLVKDYIVGCKLTGAGGGGYLYMVAKDREAAARVKNILNANKMNDCSRFVDIALSDNGLQISRS